MNVPEVRSKLLCLPRSMLAFPEVLPPLHFFLDNHKIL